MVLLRLGSMRFCCCLERHGSEQHQPAESTLLTISKDIPSDTSPKGVKWIKADYQDPAQLKGVLQGVDTVLSFIVAHLDAGGVAQKNLIDACVAAGVRRFAPSEWFS